MASSSGVVMDGDFLRHAEYTPKSSGQSETDVDKLLGGCLMAVGLAAAGFAGRYAFHLWRPLSQVITEAIKKVPSLSFSAYYKDGFEQKMTSREASLILGISPTNTKAKVREAHRRTMVLNHPGKGGSPYLAAKINEPKYLLDSGPRR
ncbi:dnaJ homolog subfamily C member 15-like [Carassius carassius]|uniref:dnaJ homolog subfamily C member 15-like n=1 Tax=Carassius carassius TaxID=217509 RepID=UPI002868BBC2|nr:dnaJ homolog subfamily C member 15-like [Carassius carassius]